MGLRFEVWDVGDVILVWPGRKGLSSRDAKEVRGELCVYLGQVKPASAKALRQECA